MFVSDELKQIDFKIVYYGPEASGKTANLHWLHSQLVSVPHTDILNLQTRENPDIFFEFLQFQGREVGGLVSKFSLYTVPGQDLCAASRKTILSGADGVIFVADSDASRTEDNLLAVIELVKNLRSNEQQVEEFPLVIQFNKRDLATAAELDYLRKTLNKFKAPEFEAAAIKGEGVIECLNKTTDLIVTRASKMIF